MKVDAEFYCYAECRCAEFLAAQLLDDGAFLGFKLSLLGHFFKEENALAYIRCIDLQFRLQWYRLCWLI